MTNTRKCEGCEEVIEDDAEVVKIVEGVISNDLFYYSESHDGSIYHLIHK